MATTSTPRRTKKDRQIDELTAEVERLRARVRALEAESASWQAKAAKHKSRVQKVRAKAEIAIAEATAAARRRAKAKARKQIRQVIADHPRAEPLALKDAPGLPERTWTLARLRTAAREQGVSGYSRMRKDQLLDVLI